MRYLVRAANLLGMLLTVVAAGAGIWLVALFFV